QEATVGRRQGRVSRAIRLAVADGGDRGGSFVDAEVGGVVGDGVVAQHRSWGENGTDGVGATRYGLTCGTAVGGGHAISSQEADEGTGEGGVGCTVGLAGGSWGDRGVGFVDAEAGGVVGNGVVVQQAGGTVRSSWGDGVR